MSWDLSVKGDGGRHSADWFVCSMEMAGCWGRGGLIQGDEGTPSQVKGQAEGTHRHRSGD